MESKMSILFYGKKSRKNNDNLLPIYLRVTIEGKRFEVTTNRCVESFKWQAKAEKVKGNTDEARSINSYFDLLKHKIYNYQREILKEDKAFCVENLRQKWFGITEQKRMLIEIFQHHNDQMKALIGNEFSKATYIRYQTTMGHTQGFLQWKYKVNDIEIKKLNFEFISDFEFWFKSVRKCNHNSTLKYISNFKKIINKCIQLGWLEKDPFFGFKMNKKDVERIPFTMEEIEIIKNKQFIADRLSQVRDIFLFCCYTGLAYIDVKKLKRSEINLGIDGEQWIFTNRTKTETGSRIPLLPYSLALLNQYKQHPQCINKDLALPVLSNQKMNAYLHEIADVAGIKKRLTFHIARHTFATTITLTNSVPIETVSKMLGHKSIRTTQIYAKILDLKVSTDMKKLREKFEITKLT
jgi:site-specific recombinase XerD